MTRKQKEDVVTGPVAVGGGDISPRLSQRLLNDLQSQTDQLPILQHALMRTWEYWSQHREGSEPMDIAHYESIGTMSEALRLIPAPSKIFQKFNDTKSHHESISLIASII